MADPVEDNALDAEALQAQIDLSMSFADELVSSWMKGSGLKHSTGSHKFETELKEQMRRPPRCV
jgi:hypothetical protein